MPVPSALRTHARPPRFGDTKPPLQRNTSGRHTCNVARTPSIQLDQRLERFMIHPDTPGHQKNQLQRCTSWRPKPQRCQSSIRSTRLVFGDIQVSLRYPRTLGNTWCNVANYGAMTATWQEKTSFIQLDHQLVTRIYVRTRLH